MYFNFCNFLIYFDMKTPTYTDDDKITAKIVKCMIPNFTDRQAYYYISLLRKHLNKQPPLFCTVGEFRQFFKIL